MLKSLWDVFPWPANVCVTSASMSLCMCFPRTRADAPYASTCAYTLARQAQYGCWCWGPGVRVCLCDDKPVIAAFVLALQRLTALFYPDLYNQCHISNTTNQTLRAYCLQPLTCARTRTPPVLLHAPSWPPHCVKQMLINNNQYLPHNTLRSESATLNFSLFKSKEAKWIKRKFSSAITVNMTIDAYIHLNQKI